MRVECVEIIEPITGKPRQNGLRLKIGEQYVVLLILIEGVSGGKNTRTFIRIDEKSGFSPALYDLRQFRIIDGFIPSVWVISEASDKNIYFAPEKWVRSGFWEDFFNDVPEAIEEFETIRQRIVSES